MALDKVSYPVLKPGDSFVLWKEKFVNKLIVAGLHHSEHKGGSLVTRLSNPPTNEDQIEMDQATMAILKLSLDDTYLGVARGAKCASQAWTLLHELFRSNCLASNAYLETRWADLRLLPNESVMDLYARSQRESAGETITEVASCSRFYQALGVRYKDRLGGVDSDAAR